MSLNSHLAPEDEPRYIERATGPRAEPATCPECGEDVRYPSLFGDPTCGEAECRDRHAARRPDPWLAQKETR